jgi:hypothetical protein
VAGDIRRAQDPALLDALDSRKRETFRGTVWRVVQEGRSPTQGSALGGRWDLGAQSGSSSFSILYTSLTPDGAIAEVEYHLSRQPVFPSRYRGVLHELHVELKAVLRFESLSDLEALGVEATRYSEIRYARTQEIGDAAAFLGYDALVAPSARWPANNLMIFLEALSLNQISAIGSSTIDWQAWRSAHRRKSRRP